MARRMLEEKNIRKITKSEIKKTKLIEALVFYVNLIYYKAKLVLKYVIKLNPILF